MLKVVVVTLLPIATFFTTCHLTDLMSGYKSPDSVIFQINNLIDSFAKEIVTGVIGGLILLKLALIARKRWHKKETMRLNSVQKVSKEEYESLKKKYTEDTLKQYLESLEFKKYMYKKQNNMLKEVELSDSDNIALSDDSSILDEDDKTLNRQ